MGHGKMSRWHRGHVEIKPLMTVMVVHIQPTHVIVKR